MQGPKQPDTPTTFDLQIGATQRNISLDISNGFPIGKNYALTKSIGAANHFFLGLKHTAYIQR